MKLGQVIRRYRVTSELTLREVGKEIGISAATLMRLEQGCDTDGRTIAKVLAWLFSEVATTSTNGTRRGRVGK